jgi:ankyrin repeat protein
MEAKPLPARPSLAQYKKQAKELVKEFEEARRGASADAEVFARVKEWHPRFAKTRETEEAKRRGAEGAEKTKRTDIRGAKLALADAQLVIAREHGFESWPKFAKEVEARAAASFAAEVSDPVEGFLVAACVPTDGAWHASGTLERAEAILKAHPKVAKANVYTAAVLGDAGGVRRWLEKEAGNATEKGGPHGWDALTYLCFSRYLRLRPKRKGGRRDGAQHPFEAPFAAQGRQGKAAPLQGGGARDGFVEAARVLLDGGAKVNTGWTEVTKEGERHWEAAIYGAAGLAQHAGLTQMLLERGADPNDEETAYHVAETYDNTVMKTLVESGKLSDAGVTTLLLRKADWHDFDGMKWLLEHGADPNRATRWGRTTFHHAVLRDNGIEMLELLLEHGADPMLIAERPDPRPPVIGPPMTAVGIGVRRGRGDLLELLERRGVRFELHGVERLMGACARGDAAGVRAIREKEPELVSELVAQGGKLLAGFAGVGNTEGVRRLLELGVRVDAVFEEGDPYFDVTKGSTALHLAAWRGRPGTVKLLLERGARVNALDGKQRTPLMLAVKACVDSYWKERRTPESVKALLEAGATVEGVEWPCGYGEVDAVLEKYGVGTRVS